MIEWILQPWPWYVAGPLIGLMVPLLLVVANKQFGISSTMQHFCAACIPTKAEYFDYDWKAKRWSWAFVVGILLGSILTTLFVTNGENVAISENTIADLKELGITDFSGLMPADIFSWEGLLSVKGVIIILVGGFLVGFGSRYAGGCTSGHAIMGLSLLNLGSLVAVIGFFIGGLIMTHLLLPLIFQL